MTIAQSRVTAKGQITVPAEIRKRLGLSPGAIVEWDTEGDSIIVRRGGRYSFDDLHQALFPSAPEAHPLEDLKEGIRRHARARHARR